MTTPLDAYYRKTYGVKVTQVTSQTISVLTTTTKLLNPNPNRIFAVIMNLSANFGFAAPDQNPSSSFGLRLNANTGVIELHIKDHGELATKEWYGINDTASGNWYVLDVVAIQ